MPGMPHGDRIRELEQSVASQSSQVEAVNDALKSLGELHAQAVSRVGELEKATEVLKEKVSKLEAGQPEQRILILEEKVTKLEEAHGKRADRRWSFLTLLLAAVIGALIGSVATWLLARYAT